MSRTGNCWDNAVAESFFATLKRELVDRPDRPVWPTRAAARQAIFDYVEVFYNRARRHSTLRYVSPAEYEAAHQATAAAAVA
jgi:transposase InsO family protein